MTEHCETRACGWLTLGTMKRHEKTNGHFGVEIIILQTLVALREGGWAHGTWWQGVSDDIDAVLLREISTGYVLSGFFLFPALLSIFRKIALPKPSSRSRGELKGNIPCSLQTTWIQSHWHEVQGHCCHITRHGFKSDGSAKNGNDGGV